MGAAVSTRALALLEDALSDGSTALSIVDRDLLLLPPAAVAKAIHLRELSLCGTRLASLPTSFGCLVLLECVVHCS